MKKRKRELNKMVIEVIRKYELEHYNTVCFFEVMNHTNKINFWITELLFKYMMAEIEY